MTDRGRSGRKATLSTQSMAFDDPAAVGARVQAHFLDRARSGEVRPRRPTQQQPPPQPTAEEQLESLRAEVAAALAHTHARIADVQAAADAAAHRAAHAVAAAQALAAELDRLGAKLPAEVAAELDAAVERFTARLRTA